jgi:hypothetical protein
MEVFPAETRKRTRLMKPKKDIRSKIRRKTLQPQWEEGESFQLKPAPSSGPQNPSCPNSDTTLLRNPSKPPRDFTVPPAA